MPRLTRRSLIAATAPVIAAGPLAKLAFADGSTSTAPPNTWPRHLGHDHAHAASGHAAMIGEGVPAVGGPRDLDRLLYPPPPQPYRPGRVREYTLTAVDRELEIAPGVFFPAWTYNGTDSRADPPGDRGRHAARPLRQRRLAPAHDPLPRDPPGEHGRGLRDRRAGRRVHLRVRGAARRVPPVPLPRDAAEEAHPQGPLRLADHRPEGAPAAGAGARDGDERLRHRRRRREQLLHRQRQVVLLRASTRSR